MGETRADAAGGVLLQRAVRALQATGSGRERTIVVIVRSDYSSDEAVGEGGVVWWRVVWRLAVVVGLRPACCG